MWGFIRVKRSECSQKKKGWSALITRDIGTEMATNAPVQVKFLRIFRRTTFHIILIPFKFYVLVHRHKIKHFLLKLNLLCKEIKVWKFWEIADKSSPTERAKTFHEHLQRQYHRTPRTLHGKYRDRHVDLTRSGIFWKFLENSADQKTVVVPNEGNARDKLTYTSGEFSTNFLRVFYWQMVVDPDCGSCRGDRRSSWHKWRFRHFYECCMLYLGRQKFTIKEKYEWMPWNCEKDTSGELLKISSLFNNALSFFAWFTFCHRNNQRIYNEFIEMYVFIQNRE